MGGFNAFEDLNPEEVKSIRDYSHDFLQKHSRRPKIVLDMSSHIVQVSTESRSRNEGIAHQLLFRRLAAYLKVGIVLVAVFDGPLTDEKRRHANIASVAQISTVRQFSPMVLFAKQLCEVLGIAIIEAPAEAEALCSWLQRNGHADAVFSGDADVLANGATCVLRYVPPQSIINKSGSKSSNAEDRLVEIFHLSPSDAPRFALMALILGNDWAEGIHKIGRATAVAISKPETKFAERLEELVEMERSGESHFAVRLKRIQWHDDFVEELNTNAHGWLSRKCHQSVPDTFPDLKLFAKLLQPTPTYDTQLVRTCQEPERHLKPLLPHSNARINKIIGLWKQPCPGFVRLGESVPVSEERSNKLLKSTLAPLLVANVLISGANTAEIKFKEVHKGNDIEVVEGMIVPPFDSTFSVGAQVAKFVFEMNKTASLAPKAQRHSSSKRETLHRIAVRDNAKITSFFQPKKSKSIQLPSRPSTPEHTPLEHTPPFEDGDIDGDTDVDEPDVQIIDVKRRRTTQDLT